MDVSGEMVALARRINRVEATLARAGARVLETQAAPVAQGYVSRTYWAA